MRSASFLTVCLTSSIPEIRPVSRTLSRVCETSSTAAADLGAGGHVLLRLEGRVPLQGLARRVLADHLWRLVHIMGTRAPRGTASIEEPLADVRAPDAHDDVPAPDAR